MFWTFKSGKFDLVDHSLLFRKLIDRGLPLPVVRFLYFWYSTQRMKVCWEHSFSNSFCAYNGVGQGGVLALALFAVYLDGFLFAVYLDGLLEELAASGVGCGLFAGAVCYIAISTTSVSPLCLSSMAKAS